MHKTIRIIPLLFLLLSGTMQPLAASAPGQEIEQLFSQWIALARQRARATKQHELLHPEMTDRTSAEAGLLAMTSRHGLERELYERLSILDQRARAQWINNHLRWLDQQRTVHRGTISAQAIDQIHTTLTSWLTPSADDTFNRWYGLLQAALTRDSQGARERVQGAYNDFVSALRHLDDKAQHHWLTEKADQLRTELSEYQASLDQPNANPFAAQIHRENVTTLRQALHMLGQPESLPTPLPEPETPKQDYQEFLAAYVTWLRATIQGPHPDTSLYAEWTDLFDHVPTAKQLAWTTDNIPYLERLAASLAQEPAVRRYQEVTRALRFFTAHQSQHTTPAGSPPQPSSPASAQATSPSFTAYK